MAELLVPSAKHSTIPLEIKGFLKKHPHNNGVNASDCPGFGGCKHAGVDAAKDKYRGADGIPGLPEQPNHPNRRWAAAASGDALTYGPENRIGHHEQG